MLRSDFFKIENISRFHSKEQNGRFLEILNIRNFGLIFFPKIFIRVLYFKGNISIPKYLFEAEKEKALDSKYRTCMCACAISVDLQENIFFMKTIHM